MTAPGRRIRPRSLALLVAALALLALAAGGASALTGPGDPAEPPFRIHARLSDEGRENTTVIVQNNSARAATIVMDFHTPAGVLIPLASQIHPDVPAWDTRTLEQALNRGLLPGFRGVGVISSDQPLNALLLREVAWPGGDGSYSIHNAHPGAGLRVALPYVANQLRQGGGEALSTRFSIANASLETACVTIIYRLMAGRGAAPADGDATLVAGDAPSESCPGGGYAVAAAGQLTLAPEAGEMALAMPAGTANTLMTVLIDSTQPVTVVADVYGGGPGARLASYNGFIAGEEASVEDDVSTRVIMPLAQKTADGRWTEYAIANPWDEPVSGVIRYSGTAAGDPVSAEAAFTLPAGGGLSHSVFDRSAGLPWGFTGAATIEADRPVAALLLRGEVTGAGGFARAYAAASGVPAERAALVAKFPLVFRNARLGGDEQARHSWISVAVADGGRATLNLVAVNNGSSGAPGCELPALYQTTITIQGSFLFDQSSGDIRATGLGATPECLTGGMRIRSDTPIIAIGAVTSGLESGDSDGLYNAFP